MPGKAAKVRITELQQEILSELTKSRSIAVGIARRSRIILLAFDGWKNEDIAKEVDLGHDQVGLWRRRWRDNWDRLIAIECAEGTTALRKSILDLLSDVKRSGRPPRITSEDQAQLTAKACEDPKDSGRPISQWSSEELADEMSKIERSFPISARWVRECQVSVCLTAFFSFWLAVTWRKDGDDGESSPLIELRLSGTARQVEEGRQPARLLGGIHSSWLPS